MDGYTGETCHGKVHIYIVKNSPRLQVTYVLVKICFTYSITSQTFHMGYFKRHHHPPSGQLQLIFFVSITFETPGFQKLVNHYTL